MSYIATIDTFDGFPVYIESKSLRTVYYAARLEARTSSWPKPLNLDYSITISRDGKVLYEEYTKPLDYSMALDLPVRTGYAIAKHGVHNTAELHSLISTIEHGYKVRNIGKKGLAELKSRI